LPEAASVAIERRHRGLRVPDRSERYPLALRDDVYTGDGVVVAGTSGSLVGQRTENRSVTVPRDVMQEMLRRLADVSVAERPYAFREMTVDAHIEIDIRVALPGSPVRFFTRSPEPGNIPWGVDHLGRNFVVVVNSLAVAQALLVIESYLLADLRNRLVREVDAAEVERARKP
jgi:hypothetical protein